jgi:hypothetical protein
VGPLPLPYSLTALIKAWGAPSTFGNGVATYLKYGLAITFDGDIINGAAVFGDAIKYITDKGVGLGDSVSRLYSHYGAAPSISSFTPFWGGDGYPGTLHKYSFPQCAAQLGFVVDAFSKINAIVLVRSGSATPAPTAPTPIRSTSIIPGTSIGSITLGMTKASIVDELGRPDRVDPSGFGEEYVYERRSLTVGFSIGKVSGIRTWDRAMRTPDGIGVGTGWPSVAGAFGKPQKSDGNTVYYYTRGVLFRYDVNFGTCATCWSLYVEPDGRLKDGRIPLVTHVEIFEPK